MVELWLVENQNQVLQINQVTRVIYQFNSLEDAKKGNNIIQKEIDKCLRGKNRRPYYPNFGVEACQKKGIEVRILY